MIKNVSNGCVLVDHTKLCTTPLSQAKGLMFSRKIKNEGLVFVFSEEERWSIHMLFVFFSIDVLWLDKNFKVVDFRETLKPFSLLAKPKAKAKYIIELPTNTLRSSETRISDKISF